jgi:hypothetical protein
MREGGREGGEVLILVQFGDNVHAKGLIQATQDTQALLVRTPVQVHNGLRRDDSRVQELSVTHHTHRNVVLGLDRPVGGIVIFVEIESSVSASGHEDISILRQVTNTPNSCLMSLLCQTSEAAWGGVREGGREKEWKEPVGC